MKNRLFDILEQKRTTLVEMSDYIFDNPEYDGEEYKAAALLTGYLEENGFIVERGIAGWDTSFRAVYRKGNGGVRIGLICEYDALKGLGHGCGHHMQGPCIC